MNYTAKQYSQALLDLSAKADHKDIDATIARLETFLKKQGKRALLARILKQVRASHDTAQGITHVHVTTASKASVGEKDITEMLGALGKKEPHIKIEHDEKIVAGVRVLVDAQWYIDTTTNKRVEKLSDQLHTTKV